jgi:quinol-cytochrome oxidoreductase complex cytochrome b subunit
LRIIKSNNFFEAIYYAGINHSSPTNLSYMWNFGSLALLILLLQIMTGFFLACYYTPNLDLAFISVEKIMRDVNNGWLIRYLHSNGASMFFIIVYLHILRGMYFSSYTYPRQFVWLIGVVILLLMIIAAFLGYVLPWGQMSYWGATVITNLVSAIPFIGKQLVFWLWGGYSLNNASLTRFYALHFLIPFLILALVIIHILTLHQVGSNNPLGISSFVDSTYFSPYYIVKDIFGILLYLIFFIIFIFFFPQILGHPDNYIFANPMVTPTHIVPEWYFLVQYAILRSIPSKLLGVIALLMSIIILMTLPWLRIGYIYNLKFKPISKFFFWIFLINVLLLGWLGANPVQYPYTQVSQFLSLTYFIYILFILPFVDFVEDILIFSK